MKSELYVLLVFGIAFLFYGLIPGIGAFTVRAQWRRFRKLLIEASVFPIVQYADLSGTDRYLGSFRMFGGLEAIQGENLIWVDNGKFTVEVDLAGVSIYLLPSQSFQNEAAPFERLEETLPDEEPKRVLWNRIFSLPAGTRLFVGGPLFSEGGRGVFRSRPKESLVVVIYDGEQETILLRAIWGGRQRNEYWNRYTMASLLTGSLSLLLTAYIMLRAPQLRLPTLLAVTASAFPLAALLPPGVAFYLPYRYFWKKARLLRAERDLLRLPLRYFSLDQRLRTRSLQEDIRLPTGETYVMTTRPDLRIQGKLTIRGSSLMASPECQGDQYFMFGAYRERGEEPGVTEPRDPMAELVLVLGNPATLAEACNNRAKVFEWLSAFFIFAGININLFLLLLVWHNLIR